MSHIRTELDAPPVRASDAERDQAAEFLRAAFTEGRLTRAEFDERLAAVYAAKTRASLNGLTGDLPEAVATHSPIASRETAAGADINLCLLLCLLFAFPPAGITYWILTARRQAQAAVPGRSLVPDASAGR